MSDVAFLNRTYLAALRTASARSHAEACAAFGVDVEFAKTIGEMSQEEVERIALSRLPLFKPVFSHTQLLKLARVPDSQKREIFAQLLLPVAAEATTSAHKK